VRPEIAVAVNGGSSLLGLLGTILPLCLASAVSPTLITTQSLLLGGRRGRRSAVAYTAGVLAILAAAIALVFAFGGSFHLPTEPKLGSGTDLALGVLLVLLAVVLQLRERRRAAKGTDAHRTRTAPAPRHVEGLGGAFLLGVVTMVVDFTTLALVVAASEDVISSSAGSGLDALAVLVILAFGALPAWLPLVVASLSPQHGLAWLQRFAGFVGSHGRLLGVALVFLTGLYLVAQGVLGLV